MEGSLVLIALTASTVLVGGCSSANRLMGAPSSKASEPAPCTLTRSDSVFLKGGAVYRECAVDQPAKELPSDFRPSWSPTSMPSAVSPIKCYSAEIEFVVNTSGLPETGTARLVSTSDPKYGGAWMEAFTKLKFEAARKKGMPVRQIVRFSRKTTLTLQGVNVPRNAGPPDC
jgi:hypothetical protein